MSVILELIIVADPEHAFNLNSLILKILKDLDFRAYIIAVDIGVVYATTPHVQPEPSTRKLSVGTWQAEPLQVLLVLGICIQVLVQRFQLSSVTDKRMTVTVDISKL